MDRFCRCTIHPPFEKSPAKSSPPDGTLPLPRPSHWGRYQSRYTSIASSETCQPRIFRSSLVHPKRSSNHYEVFVPPPTRKFLARYRKRFVPWSLDLKIKLSLCYQGTYSEPKENFDRRQCRVSRSVFRRSWNALVFVNVIRLSVK